ncbi:MAG: BrnA antitoxin family protein [Pseudomonadota bacterium]
MTRERDKQKQALIDFLDSADEMRNTFPISDALCDCPPEWDAIDIATDTVQTKEKISIRIDEDVLKFFRAMGPNYTTKINYVLRTFVMGRLARVLFSRSGALDQEELLLGIRQKSVREQMKELKEWEKRFGERGGDD